MPISSSLRFRREANSFQEENTQPLLTFRLLSNAFALPLASVRRVILLDTVYGDPQNTGISLTRYQNQEILVIDVGHKVFGQVPEIHPPERILTRKSLPNPYLIILEHDGEQLIGLPIDSPPSIKRVPASAFTPIPKAYLEAGNIQCISSSMIQTEDLPPTFILDPSLLCTLTGDHLKTGLTQ